jgi:hypothetical protein
LHAKIFCNSICTLFFTWRAVHALNVWFGHHEVAVGGKDNNAGNNDSCNDKKRKNKCAVKVVAADGRFVRSLTTDVNGAASWDGLTESGEPAPSGIYLVLVEKRAPVKIALQR